MMSFKNFLSCLFHFKSYRYVRANTGKNVQLSFSGRLLRPKELLIGNNVYIGPGFHISPFKMKISDDVLIGPNFTAQCDDHVFREVGCTVWSNREKRNIKPILIGTDVWIGANVTVLKGVEIGSSSIIAAGSVVTKNIPENSIAAGVPAKIISNRYTEKDYRNHKMLLKKITP